MDTTPIIAGIARYIVENEPVTFSTIRERARTKPWYSDELFYKIIEKVAKHPRISAIVHGTELIYRQKRAMAPREAPPPLFSVIEYPERTEANGANHEVFENLDFCGMYLTLQERKELRLRGEHDPWCPRYNIINKQ